MSRLKKDMEGININKGVCASSLSLPENGYKKVNKTKTKRFLLERRWDSAANRHVRCLLSSESDKLVSIEADVGSAEMEGETSDALPSYK